MVFGVVVAVFVLGFLLGLLAFRVKNRWCPQCGSTTATLALRGTQSEVQPR